ncbi:hydroxyquinol 1,2-dioxygenase [Sphingopyxis indica]|uniref:dioxygenase family protein n=1 Tax=Sphingopyxis indica TaxID=436663 RepID=UPI002938F8F1|nr:dioxygenase [Sphingopyxis indica]WOF43005.1 hydroxyquinol 1,2-dioxygenase [Sphingopyxis indica]
MTDRIFPELTEDALARMKDAPNKRLAEILSVVIPHLHDATREAKITTREWEQAIEFLTRTGHMCTGKRQEFILLSDVLGVSMLVDAINHDDGGEGAGTPSTVFGPFYSGRQDVLPKGASILKRDEEGDAVRVEGRILDSIGAPIEGALVEVWQTSPTGLYDVQDPSQPEGHLRASFITSADGTYAFSSVMPVSYGIPVDGPVGDLLDALGRHPNRPAHIHFMISAPGYETLVTHLFIAGDEWLESDAVFGVKPDLIASPERVAPGEFRIDYDFALAVPHRPS